MPVPSDAVIQPGETILVTGASGFVGSHVVDQLLHFGYRVRGTVRDGKKSGWLQRFFDDRYGTDKFELVVVADLTKKENLVRVLESCAGIVATASDVSFSPDPNTVVTTAVAIAKAGIEAAAEVPSIKRFVQTSSSSACESPGSIDMPYDITRESWNHHAVDEAWKPPPYGMDRVYFTYSASKVQQEQAIWAFVKEKKPKFIVNCVLPDFNCGTILNVEEQGYPSTVGMLKMIFNGDMSQASILAPQYMIDVQDTARLHVAALLKADVANERIMGFAFRKNWTNTIEIMRKLYPDRTFPHQPEGEGVSMANVVDRDHAEGLLKWLGCDGWTIYEISLKRTCDTLV